MFARCTLLHALSVQQVPSDISSDISSIIISYMIDRLVEVLMHAVHDTYSIGKRDNATCSYVLSNDRRFEIASAAAIVPAYF